MAGVAQRIDYDEFGNPTFVTGSANFHPFAFASGFYDADTGRVSGQSHLTTANQAISSGMFGGVGWYVLTAQLTSHQTAGFRSYDFCVMTAL